MSRLKYSAPANFQLHWQGQLSEYITALTWSPEGEILVASSASGEVVLWKSGQITTLLPGNDQSIDCLGFSEDGQFLAAGGQEGKVRIWQRQHLDWTLKATINTDRTWVNHLAWSPTQNQLAFNVQKSVQIWDANRQDVEATLMFESSSPLAIAWQPNGENLAVAGQDGAKIWQVCDWNDDPYILAMPATSTAIAWSQDSQYLASANLDNSVTVLQWGNPYPWRMQGFPGKIRTLTWSDLLFGEAPLLAASSGQGIAIWRKQEQDEEGWRAWVLDQHEGMVRAIAFQPQQFLLGSACEDGKIYLWQQTVRLIQVLTGVSGGFSQLSWQKQGQFLAAGGQNGELLIWSASSAGKGFGKP